jgi:glycosyltransferase involved in cell wall biosynthesis
LEYIVIDGGSTDGSIDIFRKYGPWLAYWITEPDRGQSHAINKRFARSTGEIIAWINSDDTLLPGALAKVAEAFVKEGGLGLVYGDYQAIDGDGHDLMNRSSPEFDLGQLVVSNWIAQGFVRRDAVSGAKLVAEELHCLMDWHLWLRASLQWRARRLPFLLGQVRFHPHSKTVSAHTRFNAEHEWVLTWLYTQADLPGKIRSLRRVSYALFYYALAVQEFERDNRWGAWRWITRSLCTNLFRPSPFKRLGYWCSVLLPTIVATRLQRRFRERTYSAAFLRALVSPRDHKQS